MQLLLLPAFMTIRHYSLWDRRRWAKITLFSVFGISYTVVAVLAVVTLIDMYGESVVGRFLVTRLYLTAYSFATNLNWQITHITTLFTAPVLLTRSRGQLSEFGQLW